MHTPAGVAGGKFCGEFQCTNYDMEVKKCGSLDLRGMWHGCVSRAHGRHARATSNNKGGCASHATAPLGANVHVQPRRCRRGCIRRAPSRLLLLSVGPGPQAGAGRVARSRIPEGTATVDRAYIVLRREPDAVPRTRTLHARVGGKMPQAECAGKRLGSLFCAEVVTFVDLLWKTEEKSSVNEVFSGHSPRVANL